jgi:hypothetical protein
VDWSQLAEVRDKLRAVVNVVLNIQVPYNVGSFLTSCGVCRVGWLVGWLVIN